MSLAREIFEKMVRTGQVKGEPEPLPLETPGQPSQVPVSIRLGEINPNLRHLGLFSVGLSKRINLRVRRFLQEGGAKKAKISPVKIYSKLFHEEIYVVADQEEMEALASKGVREVVYMAWEIPVLKGMDKERLRAVHLTKKVFPGSALA